MNESLINVIKSNDTLSNINDSSSISSLNSRLRRAASRGQLELVGQLLDAGAEIDSVNSDSRTAAHLAALSGHVDVIRLLAALHANLALGRRYGTPIEIAISSKNTPLIIALIETNTPFSDEVLCAAATVSTGVIQCLLNRGCNVAALRTGNQETPCHVAAWRRSDAATIDMLVNVVGVNVNARNKNGHTCCHTAATNRNVIALRCFISAGTDVDIADSRGDTALHAACRNVAADECATMLIAAGANVHHRDSAGFTACHWAARNSELALHTLLAVGADFDAPDNDGKTPRQVAMRHNLQEPTSDELALARRRIAAAQLSFVRQRAFDVCVALQSLRRDALCMCEILLHSCGPMAPLIPFHIWWQIATTAKHFHER